MKRIQVKILDRAIKNVSMRLETTAGNCGTFAIALNRVLGGKGIYLGVFEHYKMASHIALRFGGHLWDGEGLTNMRGIRDYGRSDDHPDSDIEVEEIAEKDIYRITDWLEGPDVFVPLLKKEIAAVSKKLLGTKKR